MIGWTLASPAADRRWLSRAWQGNLCAVQLPSRHALLISLLVAAGMATAACQAVERPVASPWFEPPHAAAEPPPLYVIQLMSDPRAYPILRRHMAKYLAYIEQQVIPAPPADFVLDDFLSVPSSGVTLGDITAVKAELAAIGWRP